MMRAIFSQQTLSDRFSAETMRMSDVAQAAAKQDADLGFLPEWNLSDLYPGLDAPQLKADL